MPERGYSPIMTPARRKYEAFAGNMQFPCDGRLMMAKHTGVFKLTLFLIVVSSGLFFGFDLPYLAKHVSPSIPVFAGILFLAVLACLLRTALMDPGIMPRAVGYEAAFNERGGTPPDASGSGSGYAPPARTKTVTVQGQEIAIKYCFTCRMFRPPRTSHCSLCDSCIENFDHHCPWVGNCVGRRNYRYFYLFLVSLTLYCIYVFAFVVYHLILLAKEPDKSFTSAVGDSPASLVVAIICFFSIWSVMGLCGFHTMLIAQGITTNEDIKGTYNKQRHGEIENPFDQGGPVQNIIYTLCAPVPKSLFARRDLIDPVEERAEAEAAQLLPGHAARAAQAVMQNSSQPSVTLTLASSQPPKDGKDSATDKEEQTDESRPLVSS